MPFDYTNYDAKCATLDGDALQREWEHYTRLISGAATSTAVSGAAVPLTLGVSAIGVGLAAPAIHNARKKREIIERHLQRHGRTHRTRKRDVMTAGAISGTVGVVTLGLAPMGADAITNTAVEHGFNHIAENELGVKIATHLALDAAAVAAEEAHMHSKKEQEAWKAYRKAVREGQNPALPESDLKLPIQKDSQAAGWSQDQTAKASISINLEPPPEESNVADSATMYFPPPPSSPGLAAWKLNESHERRHSTSALPIRTPSRTHERSQPNTDSHVMFATATAISNPVTAGNSYFVQVQEKSSQLQPQPSATSSTTDPALHRERPEPSSNHVLHELAVSSFPNQAPMVHLRDEISANGQHLNIGLQRRRAHSSASVESLPSYDMHQQTWPLRNIQGVTLPPPPPVQPSSSFVSVQSPSASFISMAPSQVHPQIPANRPAAPLQSSSPSLMPHEYHPSWAVQSGLKGHTEIGQQSLQHSNDRLPRTGSYNQDIEYPSNRETTPSLVGHQITNHDKSISQLTTNMSSLSVGQVYYTTPDPQASYILAPDKETSQQIPYFPPPPGSR